MGCRCPYPKKCLRAPGIPDRPEPYRPDSGGGTPYGSLHSALGEKPAGIGLWRSLVAHLTGGQGVAGSNPVSPTDGTAGQRPFPSLAGAASARRQAWLARHAVVPEQVDTGVADDIAAPVHGDGGVRGVRRVVTGELVLGGVAVGPGELVVDGDPL